MTSANCEHDKRNYTKGTNEYWSDIIFKQRAAKMYEEMSLVADKYSENDPALVQLVSNLGYGKVVD